MRRAGKARKGTKSFLEEAFWSELKSSGMSLPKREYRFHSKRLWRLDFCWPEYGFAIEIEGGTGRDRSTPSRHLSKDGFQADCEKYNAAAFAGIHVLRVTPVMINNGAAVAVVRRWLGREQGCRTKSVAKQRSITSMKK